ncbi:MAG TPA: helix-turn-helix domain-containing protein [Clostridiaceae bacterium]|nr:helix-turn-helix domain-containing protein [Clostridiaceae bacterium]
MSWLSHNEPVNMVIVARICKYLKCNIGDIADCIPEIKELYKWRNFDKIMPNGRWI